MTAAPPIPQQQPRGKTSLWAGILGAPAAWLIHLQIIYTLCPWACHTGHTWVLHVISIAFLLLLAVLAAICWLDWKRAGEQIASDTDDPPIGRKRLVAGVGLMLASLLFVATVAQVIAGFLIRPCAP